MSALEGTTMKRWPGQVRERLGFSPGIVSNVERNDIDRSTECCRSSGNAITAMESFVLIHTLKAPYLQIC